MILAILPARGRVAETVALIPRLLSTAGDVPWRLVVAVDDDPALLAAVKSQTYAGRVRIMGYTSRRGYWRILSDVTQWAMESSGGKITHVVGLANDLLPGHEWLKRAHAAWAGFEAPDTAGPLVAFNDGVRLQHAAHCLMSTALARRWYGPAYWPSMYDHLWADNELTERATQEGRFYHAPWAVLYHNHFLTGQPMDAVYQFSHTHESADRRLYERRRANGWRD